MSFEVVEYNNFINILITDFQGGTYYVLNDDEIINILNFRDNIFFPFLLSAFIIFMCVSIIEDFSK